MKKSIKFKFKPNTQGIEKIREESTDFLKLYGFSDQTVESQNNIIKELIKKGKNLAKQETTESEMTLILLVDKNTIIVEVKKPIKDTTQSQLYEFEKIVQWIRGYQDPFEPYMITQRDSHNETNKGNVNCRGLAKIAYEEGAVIDFYVGEDNILNISAVRSLNADATS